MTATLTHAELSEITGYTRPTEILAELHRLGFVRARRDRIGRVVLERDHYTAVCSGAFARQGGSSDTDRPKVVKVR